MKTAAVLTCLPAPPPANAFRPPYAGGIKPIYTTDQLRWNLLMNLAPTASTPALSQYERFLERVWLDHGDGIWTMQQFIFPSDNQPKYAREYARAVGGAGLLLHLNYPQAQKQKLLYALVQNGIDIHGLLNLGATYWEGGGLTSGHKWPCIFAGLMLDDPAFFPDPATTMLHEDVQTYYGIGWAGQRSLWKDVKLPFEEKPPSQWTADDKHNDGYRRCCNAKAWPAQTLACLLMKGKAAWNHNAYFEYVEDWMRQTDIFAANRQGNPRPAEEGKSHDVWVDQLWAAYRGSVPEQPDGTVNLKWNSPSNDPVPMKWVDNPCATTGPCGPT